MLYRLLLPDNPSAAEEYLRRGNKLVEDTLRVCGTSRATISDTGNKVDWGEGGWETLLKVLLWFTSARADNLHSTINGNEHATRKIMDHGLVCE
jgi:hypothetical protein